MSYSVCAKCNEMVPLYEKYCSRCLRKDRSLVQDMDFHNPSKHESEPTLEVRCKCGEIYSQHMHTVCPNCFAWPSRGRATRTEETL